MIRWGLRLLLLSVLLFAVGFVGAWSGWFEVARLGGVGCLALGLALLLVDHLTAPPDTTGGTAVQPSSGVPPESLQDPLTPNPSPPSTGSRGTGSG